MNAGALRAINQDLPDTARAIAAAIADAGGRALVVGGWVRDRLLGQDSKDVDFEAYGLEPTVLREVLARIGRVNTVGESFTVYKVADVDVSLPRRESKSGRGHKAFAVVGDPFMLPAEAARRRDFTVNAIAWDPLTGEYLDPFDGRADLAARRLRMVDARTFGDDSLRVLRGAPARRTLRPRDGRHDEARLPPAAARRSAGRADLGRGREAAAARAASLSRLEVGAGARAWSSSSSPRSRR